MNLITLEQVSKQYSERLLLDGVDLRINTGDRIGLIGMNGSGKTTLLRVVAGLEQPDAGRATRWGGVRVRYLPQEPALDDARTVLDQLFDGEVPELRQLRDYLEVADQLQRGLGDAGRAVDAAGRVESLTARLDHLATELDRGDGWAAEARAKAILTRLGVTDFGALAGTLSGGERKRVALARALLDPGDLLILDEPTNHIDADTIDWLEAELGRIPAALLLVTHDRYFLDRVVNRIVELDRRKLDSYPGSYSRYIELAAERHARLTKAEEDRRRLLKRELEWLRRGAKARSTKQKARIQRIDEMVQLKQDSQEDRVAIALAGRRIGRKVLEARGLAKGYGGRTLFRDLDLDLGPGDRIGIIGPNGAGKTSLLDILAGRAAPDAGTVTWGESVALGYFDQRSVALDERMKVIDYIEAEAPLIQTPDGERVTAARMLEWFLFTRREQHTLIGSLSGGERRRLYLLRTLIHRPNVLFLDEPTNDLDLATLGVLEDFLDHFAGSLIVVSHDRFFLDRTVDQLAVFEHGRFRAGYPTPYSTYRRIREEEAEAAAAASTIPPMPGSAAKSGARSSSRPVQADASPRGGDPAAAPPRKRTWKEQREIEALEARIAELEARQAALAVEINDSGADFARLDALSRELAAVEAEIEAALERWVELAEG